MRALIFDLPWTPILTWDSARIVPIDVRVILARHGQETRIERCANEGGPAFGSEALHDAGEPLFDRRDADSED